MANWSKLPCPVFPDTQTVVRIMTLSLRCPVCHNPLSSSFHASNGVGCTNNHQFDRARQGYLNLLQSHKKRSKNPGDDKAMVEARTRFLDSGHYSPVYSALQQAVTTLVKENEHPTILDAGCGEGYYTGRLKEDFPEATLCGIDISKPAILACSRRRKDIQWLIASVNELPVPDNNVDVIISIFSRCDWQEFNRVLKPGGHVLVLAPGQEHLMALRQSIYEEVRPYPVDKLVQDLPADFSVVDKQPVCGTMALDSSQEILDLLAMTPHYWHVKPSQKEKLASLNSLQCRFDMQLYTIKLAH